MHLIVSIRKVTWAVFFVMLACIFAGGILLFALRENTQPVSDEAWGQVLSTLFFQKNRCLLNGPCDELKSVYASGERNSTLAMETEKKRATYLKNWADKQGVQFKSIVSRVTIKTVKRVGRGYAFFLLVSSEYQYAYLDAPETVNSFRVGTYHTMDLIPQNGGYVISREWYRDPFYDSLYLETLKTAEINSFINDQKQKDLTSLLERRKAAAAYADAYCGAATEDESGLSCNTKYPNFIFTGGDCTNYVSQALYESGFKRNSTWNFSKTEATKSWCNAQGFKDYMLYSGRASLYAKGRYKDVYKAAYKLLPGDVIAYEKDGKIVHNVIVVGFDSKGYPLVDSHTTDRYRAPWDIGWNDSDIRFYLLHVNF